MSVALLSEPRPRALVTGICGFTGEHVARELEAAGYQVVGLTHRANDRPDWLTIDLTDRAVTAAAITRADPDVVVHLAAISFVAHGDADAIYRVNIVGTRNLLEALAAAPRRPRVVVLASSANIYGNAAVEVIDEDVPPQPANDYAVSKLAMEHMARLWADRLPIVFTRPFNYTGVGQAVNFVLPKIVDHFRRREPTIELGNIDVSRDFWDVRSVAQAYRRLVEVAPVGGTFNLCSGRAYSLGEAIACLESLAGYRIDVRVNPAFVRANEIRRLSGTNARLLAATGPLDDYTLPQTLAWMYRA